MNGDPAPVVRRFHELLVEEIRARRPEYLRSAFTVAEIYQDLVPYASHRDRLGVRMNGDYEDALLRLLAGEGGYLLLDSEAAVRDLREELETTNPNTGLYREFAAVDVRLNPAADRPAPPEDSGAGSAGTARAPDPREREPGSGSLGASSQMRPMEDEPEGAAAPEALPRSCRWCRAELPQRESVRFCPFCGGDVNIVPCPQCGEELDASWRFCIACGAEVES